MSTPLSAPAHRFGENGVSLEGLGEVNLLAQVLLTVMTAKKHVAVLVDMVTGESSIKTFKQNYDAMYDSVHPNATWKHWSEGEHYIGLFEIKSLKKKRDYYHLKTDTLLSEHTDSLLAHDSQYS